MNERVINDQASKTSWHCLTCDESLAELKSCPQGLSNEETSRLLAEHGPNELKAKKKTPPWRVFLEQFKDLLIIILLVAVVISGVMGEVVDAIVIVIIVIFASVLGFVQEYRAEKSMEALSKMAAPTASVMRGGTESRIPARELVPGDIIVLRDGDKVPADGRLIEAVNLQVEEAALTGESVPVEKSTKTVSETAPIAERINMVFAGTSIAYGRGLAVVTSTGMKTEFGQIAGMLQTIEKEKTPLEINLNRMSKLIAISALSLTAVLSLVRVGQDYLGGLLNWQTGVEILMWGVSLAIAAVPEALPAVVTISLAIGVQRMVKRHALIRKLPAVETLGCTTVICSDKTGTLTQNQMTVRRVFAGGDDISVSGVGYEPNGTFSVGDKTINITDASALTRLVEVAALCNDSKLTRKDGTWTVQGDPTEGALLVLAAKGGVEFAQLNREKPRLDETPFTSERKRMTTLHRAEGNSVIYMKGAPEIILDKCGKWQEGVNVRELDNGERQRILTAVSGMSANALRTLGFAYKPYSSEKLAEDSESGMTFLGLVGMIDPPRPEVKEAIAICRKASIRTIMVTGDHKATAVAVGRELGLLDKGLAISGDELDRMSDEEFDKIAGEVEVIARVSPSHKLRVVNALTKLGEVVAMTGDGVNDAPALRKADIGIAMGITGTDVTKESADMILTDDNFASIVAAVEEGRGLYNNIKKYLLYLLSSNLGEILLMTGALMLGPALGLPLGVLPLIAIQILYVNLATDGLPAIALSVDPPEPDVMNRKPRPRKQGIFTRRVAVLLVTGGLWSAFVNLTVFTTALAQGKGTAEAQALCFVTLILIQFFKAYNFRSDTRSVFKIGFFRNRWLNYAILWEITLLILLLYVPFLQNVFGLYPLDVVEWLVVIAVSGSIFPVLELTKYILARRERAKS